MGNNIYVSTRYKTFDPRDARTERKLDELLTLEQGWYYGEGRAPSPQAVKLARKLHRAAVTLGLAMTDVFPTPNGDVLLAIYLHNGAIELTAHTSGAVDIICELEGQEIVEIENADMTSAKQMLRKYTPTPWNSYASSLDEISSSISDDSIAPHSVNTRVESQWWRFLALASTAHPSANTYVHTTPPAQTNLRYSFAS